MDFLWYVLWYGLWYPLRYKKNHVLKWLLSSNQATLQGHILGELGDSIPTQGWLTDAVIDPELRGPVIKARAELHDCSEGHVWVLWDLLEHVLTKGELALAGKLPTYVPTPRLIRDPKTGLNVLAEAPVPTLDRVTLLLQLIDQQHPSVIKLIRAVHDRPEIALAQLLAVLLLHEWAASRPQGALHAAWALDHLYPALRPLIEEADKTIKSRKPAVKEASRNGRNRRTHYTPEWYSGRKNFVPMDTMITNFRVASERRWTESRTQCAASCKNMES